MSKIKIIKKIHNDYEFMHHIFSYYVDEKDWLRSSRYYYSLYKKSSIRKIMNYLKNHPKYD